MKTGRFYAWMTVAALGAALAGEAARASLIVPVHSSNAGAPATIYLDFDGDVTADWGPAPNPYHPGTTAAYTLDGNTTDFSAVELQNIDEIWARVSEKYSPFNINVTTVDPSGGSGVYTDLQSMRIVFGGNGAWTGAVAGGISFQNAFTFAHLSNTAYVFPANLNPDALPNGNPKSVAESAAHEAGHTFGLKHQSTYRPNHFRDKEYNPGTPEKAPIMGVSYYSERGIWWNGTTEAWNMFQDDLSVLSTTGNNGFGYRADDHTNSSGDPLTIAGDLSLAGAGIIEQTGDVDYFSFSTPGGWANLFANVAQYGPMLDLSLQLYDGGTLLASSATSSLGESIITYLNPGITYKLAVLSAGQYGDVGQYTISGSLVPEPASTTLTLLVLSVLSLKRRYRRSITA